MDSRFLKFWGDFLCTAAQGQEQLAQMAGWLKNGCQPGNVLSAQLERAYRTGDADVKSPGDSLPTGEAAAKAFQASFEHYARFWGWVPQAEKTALEKENAELKQQLAEQAELVQQLRQLLTQKGMGHLALFQQLQQLVNRQNQQFTAFLTGFENNASTAPNSEKPQDNG